MEAGQILGLALKIGFISSVNGERFQQAVRHRIKLRPERAGLGRADHREAQPFVSTADDTILTHFDASGLEGVRTGFEGLEQTTAMVTRGLGHGEAAGSRIGKQAGADGKR